MTYFALGEGKGVGVRKGSVSGLHYSLITLTFQLFWGTLFKPEFANVFPTYPAPFLSDRHAQGSLWLEERFT